MTRRRHKSVPTRIPTDISPSILSVESDANDRVRDWELPTSAARGKSRNLLISLSFLGIIGIAAFMVWYLIRSMPTQPQNAVIEPSTPISAVPKEVDELPNSKMNPPVTDAAKPDVPESRTTSRLVAPEVDTRWALAEFPTTGDRVELDPSGVYAYARNFTDACIRPPDGEKIQIAVRGRHSVSAARSFVGDGEACGTLFDEPLIELKLASGEHRAVQFGLQQGAPFVAVRRIKVPTVPLTEIRR